MSEVSTNPQSDSAADPIIGQPGLPVEAAQRHWFAVYCVTRHERSAARQLEERGIQVFLPTYEVERRWKNRQRVKVVLPLFPSYLFVAIEPAERVKVLATPGVVRLVGKGAEPTPLPAAEMELMRQSAASGLLEPFLQPILGKRMRIRSGPMQGVEGVVARRRNRLRFVLRIELINQQAALEVSAADLEPVTD